MTWMEVLRDESLVGLHAALTPDLERDRGLRRLRAAHGARPASATTSRARRRIAAAGSASASRSCAPRASGMGETFRYTYEANPGEVWEEDEFWIELPGGSTRTARSASASYFESPYRPGEKLTVDEYYRWIFENAVPGPARGGGGGGPDARSSTCGATARS